MVARTVGVGHLLELLEGWRDQQGATYAMLAARIRLLIADGRIGFGARLPAERELAARLGLSRTTVNSAYATLRADGYLLSRQGSGSIARIPGHQSEAPQPREGDLIDLSRATSSAAPGVHAAAERAIARLPDRLSADGYELAGLDDLRVALAARYSAAGVTTSADQILVTSGAQSALSLIARTLLTRGSKVIVESPSYPHALDAFRVAGARLLPVGVDLDTEWDTDAFDQTIHDSMPAMAYLMPDFHNPTGMSMSNDDRREWVRLAEKCGTVLISDETTAELNIDRAGTFRPLASFAARPDSVISVGSASKTMWGGLRVGWIRAAKEILNRLVAARFANDLGAAVIDQLVVTEMLPGFEKVLAYRRDLHGASRDALLTALAEKLPRWRVSRVEGGVAAWVYLDAPVSSALAIAARSRGLLIGAGPWFGVNGAFEQFIRIPITATPDVMFRAVDILAAAWAELGVGPRR
ncbi:PLP-dependent aminotransferase family protein [Glaciihabitans sp. dw_435]|uniref:MocR-like transcription factor YczR n=1 Tax=Glaciihabitans sp. dw_435 TaxID=2720081 RepID=UPI001BD450E2|nr:PLP-dependent aminotransferase family protein [Glaciihabitans sp. dw_435]